MSSSTCHGVYTFPVYHDFEPFNSTRHDTEPNSSISCNYTTASLSHLALGRSLELGSHNTLTMATPARPPPSPVVLFIYPATLLLGSLFSVLSPTAQGSRGQPPLTQPAGPLAPSLAADLHISESPVNYFARKNNIFNIYFVKIGWLWTTLAFASLLIAQPAFHYSASLPPSQQHARFRRMVQAITRYALATTVWYLMTQWFFGPAIIDRSFVITGGKCQEIIKQAEEVSSLSSSSQLETVFSAAACKAAGGLWGGGHDISGHVFMLVLTTSLLAFEAIGVGAFSFGSRADGDGSRERKASDPTDMRTGEQDDGSSLVRTWSLRFVWGVVGLGWWMLFMTAIWFHTWLEKVSFYLMRLILVLFANNLFFLQWSGLFVALSTVYVIYILPRSLAPWRNIVGIPGA